MGEFAGIVRVIVWLVALVVVLFPFFVAFWLQEHGVKPFAALAQVARGWLPPAPAGAAGAATAGSGSVVLCHERNATRRRPRLAAQKPPIARSIRNTDTEYGGHNTGWSDEQRDIIREWKAGRRPSRDQMCKLLRVSPNTLADLAKPAAPVKTVDTAPDTVLSDAEFVEKYRDRSPQRAVLGT